MKRNQQAARTLDECLDALNNSDADLARGEIEDAFMSAESCETVEDFDANLDCVIAAAKLLIKACQGAKSRPSGES